MFRLFLTIAFCVLAAALHAADRYDWNGRWIFERVDKDGKIISVRINGAIDIVDGKVRNLWSGCDYLLPKSVDMTAKKLVVRFAYPGSDFTIVLDRKNKDTAKAITHNSKNSRNKRDELADEFAFRIPMTEGCAASL